MAQVEIELRANGLDELIKQFEEAAIKDIVAAMKVATKEALNENVLQIRAEAPVRTGFLRRSIAVQDKNASRSGAVIKGTMLAVFYTRFIEKGFRHKKGKGWEKIEGTKFIENAIRANEERTLEIFLRGVNAALRVFSARTAARARRAAAKGG